MKHARLTHVAQDIWGQLLRRGDVAVDATAGNGHDTLALARAVGSEGAVFAFDVQEAALSATRSTVESGLPAGQAPSMHYVLDSHARMLEVVGPAAARLVCFNLGFLPGSDKTIATRTDSTLQALSAACEVLQPGGLLSIMAYTGHHGGQEEYEAVRKLLAELPPSAWNTGLSQLLNRPTAPILLLAWKR